MKKIEITVLAFVLLLSITKTSAQRFERHHYFQSANRREWTIRETPHNYNHFREGTEIRRYYDRGIYYYNQPRVVYNPVPVVRYVNYNQVGRKLGYYFYPGVNVYFSPFTHLYIYPYNGRWVSSEVLPHGVYINEPYTQVYCNVGENIWIYNSLHLQTYRRRPIVAGRQEIVGRPLVARPMFDRRSGFGPRGRAR